MASSLSSRTRQAALLVGLLLLPACGSEAGSETGGAAAGDGRTEGRAGGGSAVTSDSAVGRAAAAAGVRPGPEMMAKAPRPLRGIYLNAYAAGSKSRRDKLIKLADETEINAFVVDWKDEKGVHYPSEVPLAKQLTQEGEVSLRNPRAFIDSLHAHGIYAIARVVVFKDPITSKARPEWSIKQAGGALWRDKKGNTWVSPWEPAVWDFNIAIAEEAVRAGFDMVQFDYVRFPEPYKSLPPQVHPRAQGDRTDAIAAFLNRAKQRLHPLGAPVTADVFGLTPNTPDDLDIGQQWETINATADAAKPMAYPSHYFPTHLKGVPRPNRMPYETIYQSVGMGVVRNQRLREAGVNAARIIPWLQAFSYDKGYPYGPEQIRLQTRAVYDLGLDDWILWSAGSKYDQVAPGLERETRSRARPYTPPPVVTSTVASMEKQGVLAARQKAAAQARGRTSDPAAADSMQSGKRDPTAGG